MELTISDGYVLFVRRELEKVKRNGYRPLVDK